jgi:uncharacterized protein (TIGR00290 family)
MSQSDSVSGKNENEQGEKSKPIQVLLSWSGGKDSALALSALRADSRYQVAGLITTITADYDRISIHGVRRELLLEQARLAGLRLWEVYIPAKTTNAVYESELLAALATVREDAPEISHVAFGDLFLTEIKEYRERVLSGTGFTPLFPLWKLDTMELARRFVDENYEAHLVCVDTTQLSGSFAGRKFDRTLLADFPHSIDPCGEQGEFHTFVSSGPCFTGRLGVTIGPVVLRDDRFAYCDIELDG